MKYIIRTGKEAEAQYIGEEFSIVQTKAEAVTYDDLDTVCRKINQLTRMFTDKSFGIDKAEEVKI